MRNTVINGLVGIARQDSNVALIVGDLGYGVVDEFARLFPERFIDAGISEQAMTSLAAGLALEGFEPYIYSIGNFPTLRCLEQIRNDVCERGLRVRIIAVGSGFPYGQLGMSHHATEELAALRALPGMRIFTPTGPRDAKLALDAAHACDGPCYLRLAKGGEKDLYPEGAELDVYHAFELVPRGEVNILASGAVASEAVGAAELLSKWGIDAGVYLFAAVKPLDSSTVRELASVSKLLVTVEEHNVIGGFGGAVAEAVSEMPGSGARAPLLRLGLQDIFSPGVGDAAWLRAKCGIDAEGIAVAVEKRLGEL